MSCLISCHCLHSPQVLCFRQAACRTLYPDACLTAEALILLKNSDLILQRNWRVAANGITVDLSSMRGVVIDPVQKLAIVQGMRSFQHYPQILHPKGLFCTFQNRLLDLQMLV